MMIREIEAAATTQALASPLPGMKDGPANAFLHLIGVAELRRRYGLAAASAVAFANEVQGSYPMRFDAVPQSAAEWEMDTHNNAIGIAIGARARSFEDIVRLSREAIMRGAELGGNGAGNTPLWLGDGKDDQLRRGGPWSLPPPTGWVSAPVEVSGYAAASERFRFMGGDSPRHRQAALLERLADLPTRDWSHEDMRGVIASTPYLNASHPQHRKWRGLVREYFVERETQDQSLRLPSDDDSCGGSTEVQGYTRQGPNGPVHVSAHSRSVSCD